MTDHSRVFNLILDATEVDRLNTIIQKYRDLLDTLRAEATEILLTE